MPLPPKQLVESREETEQTLRSRTPGLLGPAAGGEAYVVPLTYVYREGRILFHCAMTGKKPDFLRANGRVCFTVAQQSGETVRRPEGADCQADHDSVIRRGTARIVEEAGERRRILDEFNRTLSPDADPVTPEAAAKCRAAEIRVEEMTGRRWRKGERE